MTSLVALVCAFLAQPACTQNIDGGRSELPGMRQDMFDQVQKNKKSGGRSQAGKGPPECPKSDMMSAVYSVAFASGEVFVRVNRTEGKCERLISIGGAHLANMTNYSKSCGPVGEWKRRIAENMSSVFFQGGFDWVKSENETIEIITEDGTYQAEVNEGKYEHMMDCWKGACGCEQANNPIARMIFIAMLVIAVGGLGKDVVIVLYDKIIGKKPAKHVECKHGHRMEEVALQERHFCDLCSLRGTLYQCGKSCNYDMCKKCYKAAKVKVKADWDKWCEKHPEDKKKSKKDKKDDDDDEKKESGKETGDESGKESGKEESGKETGDDSGKESGKDTEADSTDKDTKDDKD